MDFSPFAIPDKVARAGAVTHCRRTWPPMRMRDCRASVIFVVQGLTPKVFNHTTRYPRKGLIPAICRVSPYDPWLGEFSPGLVL